LYVPVTCFAAWIYLPHGADGLLVPLSARSKHSLVFSYLAGSQEHRRSFYAPLSRIFVPDSFPAVREAAAVPFLRNDSSVSYLFDRQNQSFWLRGSLGTPSCPKFRGTAPPKSKYLQILKTLLTSNSYLIIIA